MNTEANNDRTRHFSALDTASMLKLINDEDKTVAGAVERALPQIARVADESLKRLKRNGRVFYVGCGTSGRLGVIDASEIACTYGVENVFQAVIAGGKRAIGDASAGDEDNSGNGKRVIARYGIGENDVIVGLSASGKTPYVLGALTAGKAVGALTVGVVNNENSKAVEVADLCVELLTGAEVIEGSTRMKAGTSQKMVLNMLSTVLMAKMGNVYKNYMINMRPNNEKLRRRAVVITANCADCQESVAETALEQSDWKIDLAIVMAAKKCDRETAGRLLDKNGGILVTE